MNIFITGGHGFIGSSVVTQLVDEGHTVTCLVRETSNTKRIDHLEYKRVVGDVRDAQSLKLGSDGCDAMIHLASPSSWDAIDSPHMRDIVCGGTQHILDIAKERKIPVVVCSSIIAINGTDAPEMIDESSEFTLGDLNLLYAEAKHEAELMCESAAKDGVRVMMVNPGEVYGPDDNDLITAGNLKDFVQSWPVLVCHGGTSVVHVDDVANGIIKALEHGRPGERYILGSDNLTLTELAQLTLKLTGKKAPVVTLPNWVLKSVVALATTFRLPLPFNPKVVPYATRYFFVDNKKAKSELGMEFRSAEKVLAPTLKWLADAGHIKAASNTDHNQAAA